MLLCSCHMMYICKGATQKELRKGNNSSFQAGKFDSLLPQVSVNGKIKRKVLLLNIST